MGSGRLRLPEPGQGSQLTQAALTFLVGVVVYVIGRFIEGAVLQPLTEQRRIIAEIATALTLYANLYLDASSVEDELYSEGRRRLQELSVRLQGHNLTIPWY